MQMHILSGGRIRMPRRVYYLDAAPETLLEMPVSCVLLKHPQGNVLFDTGCNPAAADDGMGHWGAHARFCEPIFDVGATIMGQLGLTGLSASDIDVVICSHLHFDHCGCNAYFKRATIICSAQELAAAQAIDAERKGYIRSEWDVGHTLQPVEGDHDLFGDGRVTLIPLPGHTPGMMGAHVLLDRSGPFMLASDAVPVGSSLHNRYAPLNTFDVDLYMRSLEEINRLERDGATILFGHDEMQWSALKKGRQFYD